jgi:ketosteroid isomerase-like protein
MVIETSLAALYRAMLAHDIAALDDLCSAQCIYVHSNGVVENKAEFLEGVRNGTYGYEIVRPAEQRIDSSGDTAVVFDILDFQGGPRGQPHPRVRLITTLIWRRESDTWRLTHRHATRIPA